MRLLGLLGSLAIVFLTLLLPSAAFADPTSVAAYTSWECDPTPLYRVDVDNQSTSTQQYVVYLGNLQPVQITVTAGGRNTTAFSPTANGEYQLLITAPDSTRLLADTVTVSCARLTRNAGQVLANPLAKTPLAQATPAAVAPKADAYRPHNRKPSTKIAATNTNARLLTLSVSRHTATILIKTGVVLLGLDLLLWAWFFATLNTRFRG